MDLGTLLIGGTCTALCAMPFVATAIGRNKRQKTSFQALSAIAAKHNSTITSYGTCSRMAIGIDDSMNMAFFYKKLDDTVVEHALNLEDIASCSMITTRRPKKNKTDSGSAIERLELCFKPKVGNENSLWCFYDANDDALISGELDLIQLWEQRLKAYLVK